MPARPNANAARHLGVLLISEDQRFPHQLRASLQLHADTLRFVYARPTRDQLRRAVMSEHPAVVIFDHSLPTATIRGVATLLREHYPVPMLACVTPGREHASRGIEALALGITEIIPKPGAEAFHGAEIARHIRLAAHRARVMPVHPQRKAAPRAGGSYRTAGLQPNRHVIVVGASTGGPEALRLLLASMPADAPPVVIVQHMPAFFTSSFAERLNSSSALRVWEARGEDQLGPGDAVVARGDTHLTVDRGPGGWRTRYTSQQRVNRHCPSVDVLFQSAARNVGHAAVGVLLTGMGDDGARGLLELRHAGCLTFAQDHETCTVFGMPKAALELGAAMSAAAPEAIPDLILRGLVDRGRARPSRFVSN